MPRMQIGISQKDDKTMSLIDTCILLENGGVLICASSSYGALDMQLRDDARIILDKYGFDRPLLKYYWRRAMVEDVATRVVPGGPDGHHH
ncbi:hypothetical protein R6Q59_021523 [Mikania micrantha]|uniref:Uncharacterized protein n=1 Tax=Mikania micrantha TaxID=192012 RepID=A0A5N6PLP1_9ASTR|nr:hypothetical protein E3N88_05331 [Mikania micrantha]KAD6794501.1 hypothetical protein E3N88_05397 [Mikania micrantha]